MQTINTAIFDWGGVLIEDPAPALMSYCADKLGISVQDYTKTHSQFENDFQKGLITENIFWTRVCGELGTDLPEIPSLWGEAFRAAHMRNADMCKLASSLHNRDVKTGLLSNTEDPAVAFFQQQQYDMFHATVFSCQEKSRKPERNIYEIALERLGSRPEETVFIDDKQEYVDGARAAGLNTILFEDCSRTRTELSRLLNFDI